jgi:hypothetical protein
MDLVEVAPAYDVAEITALAGATIVWEYLGLVGATMFPPNAEKTFTSAAGREPRPRG